MDTYEKKKGGTRKNKWRKRGKIIYKELKDNRFRSGNTQRYEKWIMGKNEGKKIEEKLTKESKNIWKKQINTWKD